MKTTRRALAVLLSVLIAAASVPLQAVAQVIVGGAASGGAPGVAGGVPRIDLNVPSAPLSAASSLSPSLAGGLPVPSAPLIVAPFSAQPFAAFPILPVSVIAASPKDFSAPASDRAVPALGGVSPEGDAGARAQLALAGDRLAAAAETGADRSSFLDSFFTGARGLAATLSGEAGGAAAALTPRLPAPSIDEGRATPPTPITLESMAIDPKAPLAARQDAVGRLAKTEDAKNGLERVASANPDGGAADYEVHRAALKALAERGVVRSLRPVSSTHKDEILASLARSKPASAVFDYDGTLAPSHAPVSAGIAAGLKAAGDAGVNTAILTYRSDTASKREPVSILDSISAMTPEQKAKLTVGSDNGARLTIFDSRGKPVVAYDAPLPEARADDKGVGIKALRDARGFKSPMLIVGDSFFGARASDAAMSKAAPGALTLAVGGLADPRVENSFVWPVKGAEASAEILAALGKSAPADEEMDKKAVGGLFAQRTISIVAFVLTSIAYPLIAIPAVGVAGFGALMALGPLAAIATGPINGIIADRMSARNGLVLNAAMRGALALALPAFALLGVLNFWTLLLAAVANGWLLASLMITEGAYIRRLAGAKNVPMVNGLAAINYLALQVVLGLILGVGKYIDHFSLMLPFYFSAIANTVLIIPIIWKTIPNIKPAAAKVAEAARAQGEAVKEFFGKYWKEAALFSAAVGAYFVWHSVLPISGALMLWISRTDGFRAVWAQKNMRWAMLFSALLASLVYPVQYIAFPLMALTLGGVAGKGLILGQILGAYFFGQLVANAGQLSAHTNATRMPDIRIPVIEKSLPFERLVQGIVLGLAAVWAGVSLFPGSLAASAAAVAIGAGLLYGSSKLSARGWIKFLGAGLAAVLLPLAFWGSMPALFASVLLLGMFAGPSSVVLASYFQTHAKNSNVGAAIGVSGSTFNAAISFGYGLISLIVGLFTPAFPAALAPISMIFVAVGVVFFLAPRLLPGLPESSVNQSPK